MWIVSIEYVDKVHSSIKEFKVYTDLLDYLSSKDETEIMKITIKVKNGDNLSKAGKASRGHDRKYKTNSTGQFVPYSKEFHGGPV